MPKGINFFFLTPSRSAIILQLYLSDSGPRGHEKTVEVATKWVAQQAPVEPAKRGPTGSESPPCSRKFVTSAHCFDWIALVLQSGPPPGERVTSVEAEIRDFCPLFRLDRPGPAKRGPTGSESPPCSRKFVTSAHCFDWIALALRSGAPLGASHLRAAGIS